MTFKGRILLAVIAVVLPFAAQAIPPTVSTLPAVQTTAANVVLRGTVNPNGAATAAWFQWGLTTNYGSSTAVTNVGSGNTSLTVSNNLSGLSAGTIYHYRIAATNASGTNLGGDQVFTNLAIPTVSSSPATGVTTNNATLNGTVNPNGATTTAWFAWFREPYAGSANTTAATGIGSGIANVSVSNLLSGLSPGAIYDYQTVASNFLGTASGAFQRFTNLPAAPTIGPPFLVGYPSTNATLGDTVNPNGAPTGAWFQWGTNTSYGNNTAVTNLGNGSQSIAIYGLLSGLNPALVFHFRAAATNAVGTNFSADSIFTGLVPTVVTLPATAVTNGQVTLNGTVNPNGVQATGSFDLGTDTNYGIYASGFIIGPTNVSVAVTNFLSGLTPGVYHYRVEANNIAGYGYGGDQSFTYSTAPTAQTLPAFGVFLTNATLNGTVNPQAAETTAWFQWGSDTNYGHATSPADAGNGNVDLAVHTYLSGLSQGATYHYRLAASNALGQSFGDDHILALPVQLTTNFTALSPIGTNGFGIAVLGYPLLASEGGGNDPLDGVAVCDAASGPGPTRYYAASLTEDILSDGLTTNYVPRLLAYRVESDPGDLNTLSVIRNWVAGADYASPDSDARSSFGSFGLGGVSRDGSIAFRVDGYRALWQAISNSGVFVLNANAPVATILTNFSNLGLVFRHPQDVNVYPPAIGQNSDLVTFADFAYTQYATRNATGFPVDTNGFPVGQTVGTSYAHGVFAFNDTARALATLSEASDTAFPTNGPEVRATALLVYTNYTDEGTNVGLPQPQELVFGDATQPIINYLGGGLFGQPGWWGPGQISINDSGNIAFPVALNVTNEIFVFNGLISPYRTGIYYHPANSASNDFRLVTDNQNPSLFYLPDPFCPNNLNFVSDVALDNYGNVYFEASYAGTDFCYPRAVSNALYQAVANDPANPTSWTVRILLREGDSFSDPVSGDAFQIAGLRYLGYHYGEAANLTFGLPGPSRIYSTSVGPTAINRTQLPGHSSTNTTPSSAFAIGGLVIQAAVTNLTRNSSSDALLYMAPYTAVAPPVLAITISSNSLLLSWPAPSTGFVLQQNSNLVATNWMSLTNTPVVSNQRKQVTLLPVAATSYYRLKHL